MGLFGKKKQTPIDVDKFARPATAGKASLPSFQMAQVRLRKFLVGQMGETGLEEMVDKTMETAFAHTYVHLAERMGDEALKTLEGLSIDQIQELVWKYQIDLYQRMADDLNNYTTTLANQFAAVTGKPAEV